MKDVNQFALDLLLIGFVITFVRHLIQGTS